VTGSFRDDARVQAFRRQQQDARTVGDPTLRFSGL
jgi:hypothetical protein